mmetsp:Transcript_28551/g.47951  ORF Transcript_28551/g.47951 Transcript_28551/m.47951 type:complete len:211 (+) Transcript_28551:175-807(+)
MSVSVSTHPLVKHKLTLLRKTSTDHKLFRELVHEITMLLSYEALNDTATETIQIETPVGPCEGESLSHLDIALVPILRAGLGMMDGALHILPSSRVWHLGLYRDESSLKPVHYYNKLREDLVSQVSLILILDPMLATGGSIVAAIDCLKQKGATNIKVLAILAAPEGVANITKAHPDVKIFLAALDSHLNDSGYIVPGLGDAGDRQFGTN